MRSMPLRLGPKLNLSLFLFMFLLGTATAVLVLVGFNRSQDNAAEKSRQGLENEGLRTLQTLSDQQAYIEGHIPGAWQMPLQFVEGEISYMPKDKKIVTYCACPAEETSGRAVLILQKGGLENVAALQGGIDLWREMKLPLEKGLPPKN